MGLLDDEAQKKLDNDAAQLDKWDAEIARLLKKRQNRMLTAKDQARLDEIITMRAQLRLEYIGVESESYDKIQEGIENEKARAAAIGETISVDVYGDALAAAAQGHTAFIASLDAEYDSRRSNLLLIEDEAKRTQALAALDAWYAEQRQMDAEKYKETMSGIGAEAYDNAGLQASVNQIGELYTIMQNFDGSQEGLEQVQAWMNSMPEIKEKILKKKEEQEHQLAELLQQMAVKTPVAVTAEQGGVVQITDKDIINNTPTGILE